MQQLFTTALLAVSFAAVIPAASGAQKLWTGVSGDMLWSTSGNWSAAGAPGSGDNVVFSADGNTDFPYALGGSANNIVDGSRSCS